jgi:hypothetical protein
MEVTVINEQWIKTLATAEFAEGSWRIKDPQEVQRELERRVNSALGELYAEFRDSCEIYNQYSGSNRTLRVIPLAQEHGDPREGFMLLCGNTHIKVIIEENKIVARLVAVSRFNSVKKPCGIFHPCFDALGSLYWKSETGVLMNFEFMVKVLLETLVREESTRS